jgi:DNA-binding NtrC family response regulator
VSAVLHILHLEDDPAEAELIQGALRSQGLECLITSVETVGALSAALQAGGIDLLLSDFAVPASVRAVWPHLPIILISGSAGEALDVEALKSGATDYVLREHIFRLAPAVRRAIAEVQERKERSRLEAQVVAAEQSKRETAHDLNNILAVIMGNSDILKGSIRPGSPLVKYLLDIDGASVRAMGLTQKMLLLGCKEVLDVLL